MLRKLPVIIFIAASAVSYGGSKVTLSFPDGTDKIVFESSSWPTKEPAKSTTFKSNKADYTTDSTTKTDRIYVVDTASNRVASKALGEIQNNTWTVTKEDFSAVYKVKVAVSTPKGPVAAATVDFEDASGKRSELIDPGSNGEATFYFVKSGDAKIAVNYKAEGKAKDPVRQTLSIGGDKDANYKVALPDGEALAAPKSAEATNSEGGSTAAKSDAKPEDNKNGGNNSPFANLLATLLGLVFVGAVAFFIIRFMNKNPDKVKDTLTKLGADVPKPYDPSQDVANAPIPVPSAPQPMQQIILDPSAPAPAPVSSVAAVAAPVMAPVVTGIPKLIASDGSPFDLPEGEIVVGREFGAGLVVPNDTVSRRHASILKNGSAVEVQDHGSTNGTWVNGMKVTGSQSLNPGDRVRFGSIEYRFEG